MPNLTEFAEKFILSLLNREHSPSLSPCSNSHKQIIRPVVVGSKGVAPVLVHLSVAEGLASVQSEIKSQIKMKISHLEFLGTENK